MLIKKQNKNKRSTASTDTKKPNKSFIVSNVCINQMPVNHKKIKRQYVGKNEQKSLDK